MNEMWPWAIALAALLALFLGLQMWAGEGFLDRAGPSLSTIPE